MFKTKRPAQEHVQQPDDSLIDWQHIARMGEETAAALATALGRVHLRHLIDTTA